MTRQIGNCHSLPVGHGMQMLDRKMVLTLTRCSSFVHYVLVAGKRQYSHTVHHGMRCNKCACKVALLTDYALWSQYPQTGLPFRPLTHCNIWQWQLDSGNAQHYSHPPSPVVKCKMVTMPWGSSYTVPHTSRSLSHISPLLSMSMILLTPGCCCCKLLKQSVALKELTCLLFCILFSFQVVHIGIRAMFNLPSSVETCCKLSWSLYPS